MTFDALNVFGVAFSFIIILSLSVGILMLGKLISKTPDMNELKSNVDVKDMSKTPDKMSKVFVIIFAIIFIIGSGVVLFTDSKILLIVGIITIFSSLMFSGTIALYEFMIYGRMVNNMKKFNEAV